MLEGVLFGFVLGGLLGMVAHNSYKSTLKMIGDTKGYELIKGKWYRITPMEEEEE